MLQVRFLSVALRAYPCPHFKSLLHYEWYDHFNYERYETIKLPNVVEVVVENGLDDVDVDELKEEIMAFGHGSFVYDW